MYIKNSAGWKKINYIYIKTISGWKKINQGYIKTANGWKQFWYGALNIQSPVTISQSTNSTTYLITLTGTNYYWYPGPPSLTYYFEWSTDNGNTWSTLSSGTATNPAYGSSNYYTYQIATDKLSANVVNTYRFRVEASYNPLTGSSSATTTVQGPTDITNLSASPTSGSYTSMDLSWSASTGANRYMIWYKKNSDASYSFYAGTSNTSATVSGLLSSTIYNFYVVPWTGATNSGSTATGYSGNISNVATQTTNGLGNFTYNVIDSTLTPFWPSGAGINITGSSNNYMTVTWNIATYASSSGTNYAYGDQVSGVYNSTLYRTNNTTDSWPYSSSGNEYATVYAYNYNTRATITWTSSSGAVSYTYSYSDGVNTNYGTTSGTSAVVSIPYGNTCTVYYVTAWSGINGTGVSISGTVNGTNQVTPTFKSTSASAGPFYLTYTTPLSAPTISGSYISPSSGTAGSTTFTAYAGTVTGNPTPTISYQWQYFSSSSYTFVNVSGATGQSYTPPSNFNTLYPNLGFYCLITATNSQGSATARPTATLNSPSGVAPTTPTNGGGTYTTGTNYITNATFTSSASGTTPITYYWTVYSSASSSGPWSLRNSGNLSSSSLSTTLNIPQQSWSTALYGNWSQYNVYASNSYGTSGTLTWLI